MFYRSRFAGYNDYLPWILISSPGVNTTISRYLKFIERLLLQINHQSTNVCKSCKISLRLSRKIIHEYLLFLPQNSLSLHCCKFKSDHMILEFFSIMFLFIDFSRNSTDIYIFGCISGSSQFVTDLIIQRRTSMKESAFVYSSCCSSFAIGFFVGNGGDWEWMY